MTTGALRGLTVVVTRPARQSIRLTRQLAAAGAEVLRFPAVEIAPPVAPEVERAMLHAAWQDADYAVFVSANAVRHAVSLLGGRRLPQGGPRLVCVGPATARALRRAGRAPDVQPRAGYTSEALLAEPAFAGDLSGSQVLVVRGDGGRELLSTTLRERGARVTRVSVYRRLCPRYEAADIEAVWLRPQPPDVVTVTSPGIVDNLLLLLDSGPARERLLASQLVVVSPRMVQKLAEAGFYRAPLIAENATDEALVECIAGWRDGDSR